jgi:hypothetical protein
LYGNGNPVGNVDPSGNATISELQARITANLALVSGVAKEASMFIQRNAITVREAYEEGGVVLGNVFRRIGIETEIIATRALSQIPKLEIVGRDVKVGERFIDFAIRVGNRLALLEVKYTPSGSVEKVGRIVSQMKNAVMEEGYDRVVLWFLKPGNDAEIRVLITELEKAGVTSQITIVQGVNGLAAWATLFVEGFLI